MASSPFRSKTSFHVRSISLPSRSHPLIPQFNEHLCRVKASEATSSISPRLSGLEELFDCVDDLLLLPHTQQVFTKERQESWVNEVADGYLKLLDICGIAKEIFSETKQDIQQLLSMLRRRRDGNDIAGYLASRKKAKKVIQKSLKDLKNIKNKNTFLASEKNHESVAIVSMLNKVEEVIIAVFESLLSYLSGTKGQSRSSSGWSSVSKLMNHKSGASQEEETAETDEFEQVDATLKSIVNNKTSKYESENVQNKLGKLDSTIQDLEGKLECMFRRLIKTRVSLLNILNH